jgi:epoxyqueuosine reductase QueG
MRRNLAVALGNTPGEEVAAALAESAERSRSDAPSLGDPMVAEHIDWALARQRR